MRDKLFDPITLAATTNYIDQKLSEGGGGAGSAGKDGVSCTHSWDGTVLTVTSASGTTSADLQGPAGPAGKDGQNGAAGSAGKDGSDGFSPVITENTGNSTVSYKLDIQTKTGTMTTPNLQAISFVENAQVYSQEETVIGTWIDGKPLYRKTISFNMPSQAGSAYQICDLTYLNIENVSFLNGICNFSSNSFTIMSSYAAPTTYAYIYVSDNFLQVNFAGTSFLSRPCTATLEYTKTTDAATVAVASADELNAAYNEGVQSA